MTEICTKCGLPKDICVCEEIAREQQNIRIFTVRRRYGKMVTVVEGIDSNDIDINELANQIVNEATDPESAEKEEEPKPEDEGKNPAAVALGRLGGLKGGPARAKKMTAEERSEAARKAAEARWEKKKKKDKSK